MYLLNHFWAKCK